jgi:hypothetical protein
LPCVAIEAFFLRWLFTSKTYDVDTINRISWEQAIGSTLQMVNAPIGFVYWGWNNGFVWETFIISPICAIALSLLLFPITTIEALIVEWLYNRFCATQTEEEYYASLPPPTPTPTFVPAPAPAIAPRPQTSLLFDLVLLGVFGYLFFRDSE